LNIIINGVGQYWGISVLNAMNQGKIGDQGTFLLTNRLNKTAPISRR